MAGPASDYHRGEMDIHQQQSTYQLVMVVSKWSALYLAALILALTIWFCTEAGFIAGLVSAVALIVLGTLGLRQRGGH
jgi:multisubunit Na+/H+ antiporter MnhG subunit